MKISKVEADYGDAITIQKSTMGRKSSKFKIAYDIKDIISNDEDF